MLAHALNCAVHMLHFAKQCNVLQCIIVRPSAFWTLVPRRDDLLHMLLPLVTGYLAGLPKCAVKNCIQVHTDYNNKTCARLRATEGLTAG